MEISIVFQAKLLIGELFNKHINDDVVNEVNDFVIDNSTICISFHKSMRPFSIIATVTTDDYVYKFNYTGDPNKSFNDIYLNNLSTVKIEFDD